MEKIFLGFDKKKRGKSQEYAARFFSNLWKFPFVVFFGKVILVLFLLFVPTLSLYTKFVIFELKA